MDEASLRDLLAKDIGVIEAGLSLLDKEKYIPNSLGTRGFIDLYARDKNGHHVLIELKRSNAASREAIHEVLKYVEGVKRHLGARDDEIRVIIASTEWDELKVPFSRFVADTTISVVGLYLMVDASGNVSAHPVAPQPITGGRHLAPWHELNLYVDEASLQKGISGYEAACKLKGINDYVLVVLRAPPGLHTTAVQNARASLMGLLASEGIDATSRADEMAAKMPEYRFILYFAMQRLTREDCLRIIAADPAEHAEVLECLPGVEEDGEDAVLCYLHEMVGCVEPRAHYDSFEIGYPAKFRSRLLDSEGWEIERILRYGAFQRNTLLTDEDLIEELSGSHGHTGQRFKRVISVSNKAQMSAAREELDSCLYANPVWQAHIRRHLSEIEKEFPEAEIDISVFNPCAGIITIFLAVTRDDGILYVPTYGISVNHNGERRLYYGCLCAEGAPQSFRSILDTFYDGELHGLLFTTTWGGYEHRDTEILEALGLAYRSFRCDVDGDERAFFQLREERWRSSERVVPFEPFAAWVNSNEALVHHIVRKIGSRWNGGIINASSSEHDLEAQADLATAQARQVYFSPPPENCDLCDGSLAEEKFMIDGGIKGHGAWACMCPDCFDEVGRGIGWGVGQLYLKQPDGWLLVAGFSPAED